MAQTMLYLVCNSHDQWARAMDQLPELLPLAFSTRPPWPLSDGARVVEVSVVRTAKVALVGPASEPPTIAALEAQELDGWQVAGSDSVVLLGDRLLRIVDSDKRPGLSQILISDMFTAMSLGACAKRAAQSVGAMRTPQPPQPLSSASGAASQQRNSCSGAPATTPVCVSSS